MLLRKEKTNNSNLAVFGILLCLFLSSCGLNKQQRFYEEDDSTLSTSNSEDSTKPIPDDKEDQIDQPSEIAGGFFEIDCDNPELTKAGSIPCIYKSVDRADVRELIPMERITEEFKKSTPRGLISLARYTEGVSTELPGDTPLKVDVDFSETTDSNGQTRHRADFLIPGPTAIELIQRLAAEPDFHQKSVILKMHSDKYSKTTEKYTLLSSCLIKRYMNEWLSPAEGAEGSTIGNLGIPQAQATMLLGVLNNKLGGTKCRNSEGVMVNFSADATKKDLKRFNRDFAEVLSEYVLITGVANTK